MALKKQILIFGETGQLGNAITQSCSNDHHVVCCPRNLIENLLDFKNLHAIISKTRPNIIINCIAFTNVDQAEENNEVTLEVNSIFPQILAEICSSLKILLIHFSTDSVFDGNSNAKYAEDDQTNPLNIYSKSKLLAEKFIIDSTCNFLIFRVAWLYSLKRQNFLIKVLEKIENNKKFGVVSDLVGTPTWVGSVGEVINRILQQIPSPEEPYFKLNEVYHLASDNYCSKYDLAVEICKIVQSRELVYPIQLTSIESKVKRPKRVILDNQKLARDFKIKLDDWQLQLKNCLKEKITC